jgi:membrane protease YdiL (CAAX protease family)
MQGLDPNFSDCARGIIPTMSELPLIVADAPPQEAPPEDTSALRLRWFELALVLSIAFGSPVFSSLHVLATGQPGTSYSPGSRWSYQFLQEIASLLLLGYVLSRRKLGLKNLGLRWSLRDLTIGAGIAVGSYCAYIVGTLIVHVIHNAIFGTTHGTTTLPVVFGHAGVFAVPFVLLNPFFEELIVRAYLMTEVRALTGSATLAIALSVALQTAYHLYYGWQGALSLAFMFLVFAVYYSRTRKAIPIIVAHGAFDLLALDQLW